MKTKLNLFQALLLGAVALGISASFSLIPQCGTADAAETVPAKASIPWSQIGAKAGGDYQGDGLAVSPTAEGARLRCVFQRLEGESTREGLWLTSTVIPPSGTVNDRFRVVAADVRRLTSTRNLKPETQNEVQSLLTSAATDQGTLARTGTVQVADKLVRFLRPGVIEEYTVSMDGVRQDFIIEYPPLNSQLSTLNQRAGDLAVRLAVSGAKVEPAAGGAQLVLENSGRKIAYSRLRVTDATDKELTARMEVALGILPDVEGAHPAARNLAADFSKASLQDTLESAGLEAPALRQAGMPAATRLVVVVNDADAVYPVRIDPTFSDANWISMGGIPGADGQVRAAVVDGSGNLYIGGWFTVVGDVIANNIAKWNGSSWSALGSGMGYPVYALAVSGNDLYAGGEFTMAGGGAANYIAKWSGSSWSALGSGMNGSVLALAVSGSDLYAGGYFTTAGGTAATNVARWNGSSWSALDSGMNGRVLALAVSGSELYAGGEFTTAGGSPATNIAKWNGSSWSALSSGLVGDYYFGSYVYALAVSGSDVYAGGQFYTAGGSAANRIAKWNGSSRSALGSGIGGGTFNIVYALAVSGSDLYAGAGSRRRAGRSRLTWPGQS